MEEEPNNVDMKYDLFISYSREDNLTGRITELKNEIEREYFNFAREELKCFFDKHEIKGMDDWRQRLLQGLKDSHLFLLILSPNYLKSSYCEWEIVEYLKYEYARATQGDGIAQIYFMEIPELDTPGFTEKAKTWIDKVSRRQRFDFRPWYNFGIDSLKENDVKVRFKELKKSLHTRIMRMRGITNAFGNLPAPNVRFVGRQNEMKLLHESVGLGKFGVLTALHGMGGLGKTTIAIQYAYAFGDFYPGGRWRIGCASETNLATVLKKLDIDLKVTFSEDEKKDDIRGAKRIIHELESLAFNRIDELSEKQNYSKPAVLLILDNVDLAELIQEPNTNLILGKEWLKVLVTTRMGPEELGEDEAKMTYLTIDELSFDDALSLIESYQYHGKFNNDDEKERAKEIVRLLGCYTLAVEVAALYLYECKGRISCAAFLELLKREGGLTGIDIVGSITKTTIHHSKLISATLVPAIDILSSVEKLILKYASLLPPDTIPLSWVKAMVMIDYPELGKSALSGFDDPWISNINHLLSLRFLQMVDFDAEKLNITIVRMHRLVQELLVTKLNTDERASFYNNLIDYCFERSDILDKIWQNPETRWETESMVAFNNQLLLQNNDRAVKLLTWNSRWMYMLGKDQMFLMSIEQLRIRGEENTHEMATILSCWGIILSYKGRYKEAENVLTQALIIDKKIWGTPHPIIAIRLNDIGTLHVNTQNNADAEKYLLQSYNMIKKCLGLNHPETATIASNLASLYVNLERYTEAEQFYRFAMKIRIEFFSNEHPLVSSTMNNLAILMMRIARISEAEYLFRQAIEIDTKTIGEKHPRFPHRLNNLAVALTMRGEYFEAKQILCRAWSLKKNRHDITSLRILYMRITIAIIESESISFYSGQLKTLLALAPLPDYADVVKIWDIQYLLNLIKSLQHDDSYSFLYELLQIINMNNQKYDTKGFTEWISIENIPLDVNWYEYNK